MEADMKGMFAEKSIVMMDESMELSKLSPGKKNWQSPELIEVDYSETNSSYTGIASADGLYYS